jgi:hypothetical protein
VSELRPIPNENVEARSGVCQLERPSDQLSMENNSYGIPWCRWNHLFGAFAQTWQSTSQFFQESLIHQFAIENLREGGNRTHHVMHSISITHPFTTLDKWDDHVKNESIEDFDTSSTPPICLLITFLGLVVHAGN